MMKKIANRVQYKTVCLFLLFSLFIFIYSCGKNTVILAPPDWILGTWQSDSGSGAEYILWVFTADNAVYEYHDSANSVQSTINLEIDFMDKWIRDEVSDEAYEILIDRNTHSFYPQPDETTGLIDDPTILDYYPSGAFSSRSWELTKQ